MSTIYKSEQIDYATNPQDTFKTFRRLWVTNKNVFFDGTVLKNQAFCLTDCRYLGEFGGILQMFGEICN